MHSLVGGIANVHIWGRTTANCEELVRDLEMLGKGGGVFKNRILDSLDHVLDLLEEVDPPTIVISAIPFCIAMGPFLSSGRSGHLAFYISTFH